MIYLYDGSFKSLLSTIFLCYRHIENVSIKSEFEERNFLEEYFNREYSEENYKRVRKSIVNNFSNRFYNSCYYVYLSDVNGREDIIARTLKGMYLNGYNYINSSNTYPTEFRKILKNVSSENHKYKGFLRFEQIDGGYYFAKFEPKANLLPLVIPHFISRMPNEKFVICDVARKIAGVYNRGLEFIEVKNLKLNYTKEEEDFKNAWRKYYSSTKIKERENKKLMINNMPKRYWKFLPERLGTQ